MQEWFHVTFPLTDPVQIFLLTLVVVLFAPLLFKKFKIPGIVGLILSGMLVGPHGLNLLTNDVNYRVFGTVGLLYLMFLMGLELDFSGFKKQLAKTAFFGIMTFAIPFALGFYIFRILLDYSLLSSLLIASSFSTHTLLSYPIVRRLGITRNTAVTITIGATVVTDTAVLMVLTFISNLAGDGNSFGILRVSIALIFLIFLTLWGIPRISRWFFKLNKGDSNNQFLFVLTLVFLSAFAGQLFSIEPIIGAFLSGLALNMVIPASSHLMNRLTFFGHALFIPFFLLSVGMIINPVTIFASFDSLQMGIILLSIGLLSKYLAAWTTQKKYRMSSVQRNVMFGLSSSHAAAILAVLLVGYRLELIDDVVLNGTLIFILGSCLVSSYVTELSGRKLATSEPLTQARIPQVPERILIPIANPETIPSLAELACLIKDPSGSDPLFFLAVGAEEEISSTQIQKSFQLVYKTVTRLGYEREIIHPLTATDVNISQAILRNVNEMMISKIIMGWSGSSSSDFLFGKLRDNVIAGTERMIIITRTIRSLHQKGRIVVVIPPFAEFESGFDEVIRTIYHLSLNTQRPVLFSGAPNAIHKIELFLKEINPGIDYSATPVTDHPEFQQIHKMLGSNDFLLLISARPGTISFHHATENLYKKFFKETERYDAAVIYPAQQAIDPVVFISQMEAIGTAMVPPISRFNQILKKLFIFIFPFYKKKE